MHMGVNFSSALPVGPSECNDGYRGRLVMEHCYGMNFIFSSNYDLFLFL